MAARELRKGKLPRGLDDPALLDDPGTGLAALDRLEAAGSLSAFIELAWPVLEPGRRYRGNWHIDALCRHLEAVSRGEITRLLINVPPGTMKSLTVSVFWPAWEWGPWAGPGCAACWPAIPSGCRSATTCAAAGWWARTGTGRAGAAACSCRASRTPRPGSRRGPAASAWQLRWAGWPPASAATAS
ncbi:hypothetical protein [Fodinicurvata halophila]|uniref:hypothetical protein n=1 Tax=Fodinicurvata halophila TaxID=1419723 RepID=UPI003628E43E